MKDLISKVTFGFLMAQFLPGAVVVYAVSFAFWARWVPETAQLLEYVDTVGQKWFGTSTGVVVFVFFSIAVGMLIHGLHWTVIGWLEYSPSEVNPKPIRERWWHRQRLALQLIYAPVAMTVELISILLARKLDCLTVDENVCCVAKERMACFTFLQEFYLYFAQFYAHMGYAVLVTVPCFSWTCWHRGFSQGRVSLLVGLYFIAAVFFLLGRVQLSTLFKNERKLAITDAAVAAPDNRSMPTDSVRDGQAVVGNGERPTRQ